MAFQQPPVFSDKIPMQAQALMMQPEAVNMLKQLNGLDLISLFWFQMPFMILPKERTLIQKSGQKLLTVAGLSFLAGVIFNVQMKRISMNFLRWPFYSRYLVRLGVMAIPFAIAYPTISEKFKQLQGTLSKIQMKKNQLLRTKDLEEYFQLQKTERRAKTGKKK